MFSVSAGQARPPEVKFIMLVAQNWDIFFVVFNCLKNRQNQKKEKISSRLFLLTKRTNTSFFFLCLIPSTHNIKWKRVGGSDLVLINQWRVCCDVKRAIRWITSLPTIKKTPSLLIPFHTRNFKCWQCPSVSPAKWRFVIDHLHSYSWSGDKGYLHYCSRLMWTISHYLQQGVLVEAIKARLNHNEEAVGMILEANRQRRILRREQLLRAQQHQLMKLKDGTFFQTSTNPSSTFFINRLQLWCSFVCLFT